MKKNLLFIILPVILLANISIAQQSEIRIGVIADFNLEAEGSVAFTSHLKQEIEGTLGSDYQVVFSTDLWIVISLEKPNAAQLYNELSLKTDIILAIGTLSAHEVGQLPSFPIPTYCLGIMDPEWQNIPLTESGTSGKSNFSYLMASRTFKDDIEAFKEIYPFKKVAILHDRYSTQAFMLNEKFANNFMEYFNYSFELVSYEPDLIENLKAIPDDVDAVFIAMPLERDTNLIKQVAQICIEKKLPSFSQNRQHLDYGILACMANPNTLTGIFRKIALIVESIANKDDIKDEPVYLNYKRDLFINSTTMRAINFAPTWELLYTGNFVYSTQIEEAMLFDYKEIVLLALENSQDILAGAKDIELADMDLQEAKSGFLPRLEVFANGVMIDSDRALASMGSASELSANAKAQVEQLVYSNQAIQNIRINRLLNQFADHAQQQVVNDIMLEISTLYFNILQAKTNVNILKEDFETSKNNLELAEIRVNVGHSNKSDVYRWETEVANSRQKLLEAQINLRVVKLQLNNHLNNALHEDFEVVDIVLGGELYTEITQSFIPNQINEPIDLVHLTEFLVNTAMEQYPVAKQIQVNQSILTQTYKMHQRSLFHPTVGLYGSANQLLAKGGDQSQPLSIPGVTGVSTDDLTWEMALNLSIPIIDRNQRNINLRRTQIQQDQLQIQKENLDGGIQVNVSSKLALLIAAATRIRQTEKAAESASKSYEMVLDAYKKGTANLIQLIDAQKTAFSSRQGFNNSVYQFLIAFTELEHSIGMFHILQSEEEVQKLRDAYNQYILDKN